MPFTLYPKKLEYLILKIEMHSYPRNDSRNYTWDNRNLKESEIQTIGVMNVFPKTSMHIHVESRYI